MPHDDPSNRPPSSNGNGSRECVYCHKRNHIISSCPKLQAKKQQLSQNHSDTVPKEVGLVACVDVQMQSGISESEPILSQLDSLYAPYCRQV